MFSMLLCNCCECIWFAHFGGEVDCYHTESGFAHVLDFEALQPNEHSIQQRQCSRKKNCKSHNSIRRRSKRIEIPLEIVHENEREPIFNSEVTRIKRMKITTKKKNLYIEIGTGDFQTKRTFMPFV